MTDASSSRYTVRYEDRGPYLYAYVSGGVDSVETSLAYWREIADEARRRNATRVLLTESFDTQVSVAELFEVAEKIPEIVRGLVVAFVDERFEHFEENRFGEDVAVNRGAVGKVFAKEADAVQWLESI